jgi:hypothetical protein
MGKIFDSIVLLMVKWWSNGGQMVVKWWSNGGQMVVKWWSNGIIHRRWHTLFSSKHSKVFGSFKLMLYYGIG